MGIRSALLLGIGVALAGCTVGPDYQRPSLWSPASWFQGSPAPDQSATRATSVPVAEPVDPEWWAVFGDPVLTGLMRRAAASNLDVRAATARLAQSRAQVRITGAAAYPDLNTNGSYTRQRPSERGVLGLFGGGAAGAGGAGQGALNSNGLGGRQGGGAEHGRRRRVRPVPSRFRRKLGAGYLGPCPPRRGKRPGQRTSGRGSAPCRFGDRAGGDRARLRPA